MLFAASQPQIFRVERSIGRTTVRIFMSGQQLFRSALALSLVALCTSCAELEKAKQAATDAARTAAAALQPKPDLLE